MTDKIGLASIYTGIDADKEQVISTLVRAFIRGRESGKKYLTLKEIMELSKVYLGGRELRNLAESYPLIFFFLSADRFVLSDWILEDVGRLVELEVSFSKLYEHLQITYNSRAFSRDRLAKLLGTKSLISKEAVLGLKRITRIVLDYYKDLNADTLAKLVEGIELLEKENEREGRTKTSLAEVDNGLISQNDAGVILKGSKDNRAGIILRKRAEGETLTNLAVLLSVSSERVRQVEKKALNDASLSIREYLSELVESAAEDFDGVVDASDLEGVLGAEDKGIIQYVLKNRSINDWLYIPGLNLMLYKPKKSVAELFDGRPENLPDPVDSQLLDKWAEMIRDAGIRSIDKPMLKEYLISIGYKVKNGKLVYEQVSIRKALRLAVEKLTDEVFSVGDPKDTERLRTIIKSMGVEERVSDKTLWATVMSNMVLCGRGQYCSHNRIKVSPSLLEDIVGTARKMGMKGINYRELFSLFEARLLRESNIDNHDFLHGVLMHCYPDEFIYKRGHMIYEESAYSELSSPDLIESFIKNKERIVSRKELNERFAALSNFQMQYALMVHPEILLWDENSYLHTRNLRIMGEDKRVITKWLEGEFALNNNYTSSHRLYLWVTNHRKDMCERLGIKTDQNVFRLAEYLLRDEHTFSYPHIVKDWKADRRFTTIDLVEETNQGDKQFSRHELERKLIERIGKAIPSVPYSLRDFCNKYIRVSGDQYATPESLGINEAVIKGVEDRLKEHFRTAEILDPASDDNWHKNLPKLSVPWNPFILGSIIELYLPAYKTIGKTMREGARYRFTKS